VLPPETQPRREEAKSARAERTKTKRPSWFPRKAFRILVSATDQPAPAEPEALALALTDTLMLTLASA
jgi:hypothetical protein